MFPPVNIAGKEGLEVKAITQFELACVAIDLAGFSKDAKTMTTFEFFNSLEAIKKAQK